MRFLLDAQLPPRLCRWLEARGHEAEHVADAGLSAASDTEVAAYAAATQAALMSKDEDFLILHRRGDFTFVWLRCGNSANRALVSWLEHRWAQAEELLGAGETLIELR